MTVGAGVLRDAASLEAVGRDRRRRRRRARRRHPRGAQPARGRSGARRRGAGARGEPRDAHPPRLPRDLGGVRRAVRRRVAARSSSSRSPPRCPRERIRDAATTTRRRRRAARARRACAGRGLRDPRRPDLDRDDPGGRDRRRRRRGPPVRRARGRARPRPRCSPRWIRRSTCVWHAGDGETVEPDQRLAAVSGQPALDPRRGADRAESPAARVRAWRPRRTPVRGGDGRAGPRSATPARRCPGSARSRRRRCGRAAGSTIGSA